MTTSPAAESTGVSAGTEISFEFSEGMTRTRVERFVTFYPRITIGKVRWQKDALILQPQEPLHPDTTYFVEIKAGFSDAHGVKAVSPFRFAFATATVIDTGVISGHVLFRRKPTQKGLIRLFVLPRDTSSAPEEMVADRELPVGPEGMFRFAYLPTDEREFLLWAFEDADGNGAFGGERDVAVQEPDTVSLTGSVPTIGDLNIFIVDPSEPAEITGKLINQTGIDTFPITVTMHAVSDTTPPTHLTRAGPDGEFKLGQVLKGRYTLWAFMDFQADSLCGTFPCWDDSTRSCTEPCAQYPDTLTIEPGQKIKLEDLILEPPNPEKE
jgi:hypothetical protein